MGFFLVSVRGSPYGNGDPHMENIPIWGFFLNSQMGMNSLWEPLVTETVPIWKRGRVNPCFRMGISVWKQGAISFDPHMETRTPHFHMGICHSPFPCGDPRM
jgi:hypothetical protein